MNKDKLKTALVFMFIGVVLGGIICYGLLAQRTQAYLTVRDTTTYIDVIPYYKPIAKDSSVVRYVTQKLPVFKQHDRDLAQSTDTFPSDIQQQGIFEKRDSLAVEVPITQKCYEGDDYRAYVSGFQSNLDSIFVFSKTTTIRERSYKPPNKWHIGITGGYGYGFCSKQAEPYIGVGITYSIISF